jgi:predicted dehydrogenase
MDSAVKARLVIDDGRIGRVVGMQATMAFWQTGEWLNTPWRYDPKISGGGQLLDSGIHSLDTMLYLCGPAQSLSCMTTRFRDELGGEDTSVVNLRFESGALGSLFSSQAVGSYQYAGAAVVFGTEGVLTFGGPHGALTLYKHGLPEGREVLLETWGHSFANMANRYLDTVLNSAPNPSPGESGRENLRLVLAAYESEDSGREIRLVA